MIVDEILAVSLVSAVAILIVAEILAGFLVPAVASRLFLVFLLFLSRLCCR
jgi:hypothetical protein